jgi:lysophospholipase L1-like esterase
MMPGPNVGGTSGAGGAAGAAGGGGGAVGLGGSISGGAGMASNPGGAPSGGSAGQPVLPACEVNDAARCTGTSPITCDFAGGAGDFLVTLDLGGADASTTYVEAEANRRVLGSVELAAGESKRFAFGVNVRQPEGQPIQNVPAGTPGLQLYLRGEEPKLSAVCVEPLAAMPKVWIAGDSTVCDQSDTSYAGWGQFLPQHFAAPSVVANYADSGESSASVLASAKLWGAIKGGWKAGDWVLVQVGHNDKTVTTDAFRDNITAFVTQAKAADVHIILLTPISRATGSSLDSQHRSSAGANIPQIIKDVAQSQNVPVIDLTTLTWTWLQTVDWHDYFALGTDATHPNQAGAGVVAELVRDAIREQQLELAKYLR